MLGRGPRSIAVGVLLLVAACSGGSTASTTTTSGPPTTVGTTTTTIEITTTTSAPRPLVAASFEGITRVDGAGLGPDTAIAAGEDRVVMITNQVIAITDKSGLAIDARQSADFLAPAPVPDFITSPGAIADPHVAFDRHSGRFLVVEAAGGEGPGCEPECAYQLLAVSKDGTPDSLGPGDWWFYGFDRTVDHGPDGVVQTNNGGDRDLVAASESAVVISSIDYDHDTGAPAGANLRILEKAPLLEGTAPESWRDVGGITDPATGEAELWLYPIASDDGRFFFVSRSFGCLGLTVWALEDPLEDAALTGRPIAETVDLPGCGQGGPVAAIQPGDAPVIRTDGFTASGTLAGGSLFTAATVRVPYPSGAVTGIGWVELDLSAWPETPTVIQSGALVDEGVFRFVPAATASPAGDLVIGFAQSSVDEFPSLYMVHRQAGDSLGELREPVLLRTGEDSTTFEPLPFPEGIQVKFADYYGADTDPTDGSAWVIGQFAVEGDGEGPDRGVWVANVAPWGGLGGVDPGAGSQDPPPDDGGEASDETPVDADFRFHVGTTVTARDDAATREAFEAAMDALEEVTGYRTTDFDVFLFADSSAVAEAYCEYHRSDCDAAADLWQHQTATVGRAHTFLRVDDATWPETIPGTALQEYLRILQWELADPHPVAADDDQVPAAGPVWMTDGQASYFEALVRIDGFPFPRDAMENNAFIGDPNRPSMASLETQAGMRASGEYSGRFAQFAVYTLLADHGSTLSDLLGFYERVGEGIAWEEAFEITFGVSVSDFYAALDAL